MDNEDNCSEDENHQENDNKVKSWTEKKLNKALEYEEDVEDKEANKEEDLSGNNEDEDFMGDDYRTDEDLFNDDIEGSYKVNVISCRKPTQRGEET